MIGIDTGTVMCFVFFFFFFFIKSRLVGGYFYKRGYQYMIHKAVVSPSTECNIDTNVVKVLLLSTGK